MSTLGFTMSDKNPVIYNASAGALIRLTNSGFGFAITPSSDNIYEKHNVKTKTSGTMVSYSTSSSSTMILDQSNTRKTESLAPALSLGWGYKTSDRFSWGISVNGGVIKTTDDTVTAGSGSTNSYAFADSLQEKTKTLSYCGNISLGFVYKDDNAEAGLLITTSDLYMDTIDYSYKYDGSTTTLSAVTASESKKTKNSLSMSGPPSLTLGFRGITQYADFIGEISVTTSGSRTLKSFSYNYDTSAINIKSTENQNGISASSRGGIIFHPSAYLRLIGGCGYSVQSTKEYTSSDNSNTEYFTQVLTGSAGIECTLGRATVGAAGAYAHILSKGNSWQSQAKYTARSTGSLTRIWAGASILL